MQSKGLIRFVAILIAIACIYQLSFTAATAVQEKRAVKYADNAALAIQQTPQFKQIEEENHAFFLDSIRTDANKYYIDSISTEKVYFGYTYKQIKEKEINLGLDLKGGMNVLLQLDMSELVKSLAVENYNPNFEKALSLAKERSVGSREEFIPLFAKAWEEVAPGQSLYYVFDTPENADKFKSKGRPTNDDVIKMLENEAKSAIDNSYNVVEKRINQFGVSQPSIQKIGNTGRILVELPGVKEPERVRKLLQGTASLEFWTTYENSDIFRYLQEANDIERQNREELAADSTKANKAVAHVNAKAKAVKDTVSSLKDSLANELASASDSLQNNQFAAQNPLFSILQPSVYQGQLMNGACVGRAHYRDTAKVNAILRREDIRNIFPNDLVLMWTFKPTKMITSGGYYDLVALKKSGDKGAALEGTVITNASVYYNNMTGSPEVDMTMNSEGAARWKTITGQNIGHQVAVVMDGTVYSYPNVQSEISGGRSQITGQFTQEESQDLANVLKSGKLSAPVHIVQEQVVGPTLGKASIHAGMISFLLAFVLVLIYMFFFYAGAGLVADVALICNIVFLFGALVSFGAVLTLPGIAGLVLTMGMAVDSNVIIYERIREEIKAGKSLRLAVEEGYKHAYSAIIDGNVTTILTGIILYFFGSGPVKSFAAVLIIGILTSLFTSIFISHMLFDDRLKKGKSISFDRKVSRKFLENTHIDFINARKVCYIISSCLILISVVSMFTKGFSFGVDFAGGRTYVIRFDKPVSSEDVRRATAKVFPRVPEVKQFGGPSQMRLTTDYKVADLTESVDREIEGMLYESVHGLYKNDISKAEFVSTLSNPNGIIQSDRVAPSIASDMQRKAIIAVILAWMVIFVYIALRFRSWSFGLGGVACLVHDSIIVIGFFSLFSGILPFNLDVDSNFIAAVLTIIGYSINDTVVIYDRIREYRKIYPKRDLKTNVNDALNSTLTRTFNTSMTTLVVLLSIAIFGGEVIRGFSVALILGIIIGTYSSLFVSATIVYDVTMSNEKKLADKKGKTTQPASLKRR
ncbi:MAG: protein translocase subunit SecDF [Bacteroidales bacterium]|jgi:SecD/SecF fusion protein|nr:protein translocase subunit SecDF [Bacteroidales bacterium]MCI2121180.1 protein translocase subunit SecDF [Bacteroidales bacterium]MCI2145032.1 protein translocase subunit SecDF [Bacteroidales bacterium]